MGNDTLMTRGSLPVRKFLLKYALYIMIGIIVIIYASMTPLFLSAKNITELLANSSPLMVATIGITFALLIGEIDLSIGSIAGLSAAVWIVCTSKLGIPLFAATLIAIASGALIGAINGFLIVKLKINSFLATLGMQIFLRGFIYITVSGQQSLMTKDVKSFLGLKLFGSISPLVIISILLAVIMMLVYRYTSFGRKVQAVGCNKALVAKVGIKVNKVTFAVYIVVAIFAAIAGIMQSANVGILNPSDIGEGMEFLAITAAVLGGTSLFGGVGTIIPGTLVGVILLMMIENGLGLLGANPYIYPVIRGIIIYLAMFSDSLKRTTGVKG